MTYWITLRHEWKLQDVQAALNVVVTIISALGLFVLTRCCWQLGARAIAHRKLVATSSLFTLNTIGEVVESLFFFRFEILGHGKVFLQCVGVVVFTLTTLFSGIIARYSTRATTSVIFTEVDGFLAGRFHNSMGDAQVPWNLTQESLIAANFPGDQLLDFIPKSEYAWVYQSNEWNSSWSLNCTHTERTEIQDLVLTDNCTTFTSRFGAKIREEVFPHGWYSDYYKWDSGNYYVNSTWYQDALIHLFAANYSAWEEDSFTYTTGAFAIAALHVHGLSRNETSETNACNFGAGPVQSAYFTRVVCSLTRKEAPHMQDTERVAYPDCGDQDAIPSAFAQNYFLKFKQQSMADEEVELTSSRELLRFYQTYMIMKDTQQIQPVRRLMSVRVPAVQVASAFIAVCTLLMLLIIVGGALYGVFLLRHRGILGAVPQSKLDWLLQSLDVVDRVNHGGFAGGRMQKLERFEMAVYDGSRYQGVAAPVVQQVAILPPKAG